MCVRLDAALAHFAQVCGIDTRRPGAGAAGGVGAALFTFLTAAPRAGIEVALELTDFAAKLQNADCVFTGEGRTDSQTANGKAVCCIYFKFGVITAKLISDFFSALRHNGL